MDKRAITTEIYGNHEMYSPPIEGHPNGVLMYRNTKKRIQWYLDRGLATLIDVKDGIMIAQLHDIPNGLGRHGDPFTPIYENRCVVTGNRGELNRHHIVPKLYRNLMPLYYKKSCHHDIVAIDVNVHSRYEIEHANTLKGELADKYDAPLNTRDFGDGYYLSTLAFSYIKYKQFMSEEKKTDIFNRFKIFLNKSIITDSDVEYLISLKGKFDERLCNHGKIVLDGFDDMQGFIEMWREHFLDTMKPEFMPDGWDVKRPIDIVKNYKKEYL